MWKLLSWLSLVIGLVAGIRCPDGQVCSQACCREPEGLGYYCCNSPLNSKLTIPVAKNGQLGVRCQHDSHCPVGFSCLFTPLGNYSCCPYAEAVVCGSGHHCCPRGFHCSPDGHSCFKIQGDASYRAVKCPDSQVECPNESTCCLMPDGTWGCCPFFQATCCEDRIHCCPQGTSCDVPHDRCITSGGGTYPLAQKTPAKKIQQDKEVIPIAIICPDGHSLCPEGATCCKLPWGGFGCCLLPNAVCCPDHVHCCPEGTTCDFEMNRCISAQGDSTDLVAKLPALTVQEVKCEEDVTCPSGNTCCRLPSGSWGCCSFPEAVCCDDHIHCCPQGYTCDTQTGQCNRGAQSAPWLEIARASLAAGGDVICDNTSSCPPHTTCCILETGQWGCCPVPEAVCCPDHEHCCPHGYTCDPTGERCVSGHHVVPWLQKVPAHPKVTSPSVDCDQHTRCPDGQTCCPSLRGHWACCQLPHAVCCEDREHCCPSGYTCNVKARSCEKQGSLQPPTASVALLQGAEEGDLQCEGRHYCHNNQTCCRSSKGRWACCPLNKGVCCADGQHCCPSGFRCGAKGTKCIRRKTLRWDHLWLRL